MGKRELVLIAAFLLVGVLVYQVTAPPAAPGEEGFSAGKLINNIRRELGGNRANAEKTTTATHPAGPGLTELRLDLRSAEITVTGEDRGDISVELHVRSTGYDAAEAEQLAKATALKLDDAGTSLIVGLDYPEGGRQYARLVLKVPSRLAIRLDQQARGLIVTGVRAVEIVSAAGNTQVRQIAERVVANQVGGNLVLSDIGSLKLTTRGSDVTIENVRGEVSLNTRSGELKGTNIAGPIEIESNTTDVTFNDLQKTTTTFRATASNGTITLRGLASEGRIDARNADVVVEMDRAAPLSIYSDGGDDVRITMPAAAYRLDATTSHGRISVPDGTVKVDTSGEEQRANGAVRGGGATIMVRSEAGDITVVERGR